MGSKYSKGIVVLLLVALAIGPASALATPNLSKDYSKNGATGDYAPAKLYKDYSKNGATGDYAPAVHTAVPAAPVTPAAQPRGFAWGDAAAGAAVMLCLVLVAATTSRLLRRRRIAVPTPARPSV